MLRIFRELTEYEEVEIKEEYERITRAFPDKPPVYYLKAVWKNLTLRKEKHLKELPPAKLLRDIFNRAQEN